MAKFRHTFPFHAVVLVDFTKFSIDDRAAVVPFLETHLALLQQTHFGINGSELLSEGHEGREKPIGKIGGIHQPCHLLGLLLEIGDYGADGLRKLGLAFLLLVAIPGFQRNADNSQRAAKPVGQFGSAPGFELEVLADIKSHHLGGSIDAVAHSENIAVGEDPRLPPGSVTISFFCEQSERGTHCLIDRVMEITCGLSPLPLLTKHGLP